MKDIVIGSGPAGISAAWALLKKGHQVLMLDTGEEIESDKLALKNRLASSEFNDWSQYDIDQYTNNRHKNKIDSIQPFGSDFLFRDPTDYYKNIHGDTIGLRPSFAKGGLSNGWGSAILPYREEDISDWPSASKNLKKYYQALKEFMPIAAQKDALAELFPMFNIDENTSLPPSTQAKEILKRLDKNKEKLNASSIYYGHARQAVSNSCVKCGMCLYGCPYDMIFNTSHTLEKMLCNKNFEYAKNIHAVKFVESEKSVQVIANETTSNRSRHFEGNRIYIACGVLATAKLVTKSLGKASKPLFLKDSTHFYLPSLHIWRTTDPSREKRNSLVQLFFEVAEEANKKKTAHIQTYTFNDLYEIDMKKRFGIFAKPLKPLSHLLSRRLIVFQGFLHSDYSPKIELKIQGDSIHFKSVSNSGTDNEINRIMKKISKISRSAGLVPLKPLFRKGSIGSSFHCGSTFPMKEKPSGMETDTLGRVSGLKRTHIVDASIFPSIPATTITLSVMANSYRIATESPCI